MTLSEKTLSELPASIKKPEYNRGDLKVRMVHLGFGAFHRAHQAVYTDILSSDFSSDWGYCEVNLRKGEIIDLLNSQDCLYTVNEMAHGKCDARVIGVIRQALCPAVDGMDAILDVLAQPEVAIVSLTITEKGYFYEPASGKLLIDNELIENDILSNQPRTVPGILIEALRRRKRRGLPPFSVLSCDNIPENGKLIKSVVLQLASLQKDDISLWIKENVTFPSTMVDRIVPAMTNESTKMIERQLENIKDDVAVVCEPFRQWVIEDNFVNGRPEWEKAGAELVKNVVPYEEMKLRMLNGSHSFLAYIGLLAGKKYIFECMEDADLQRITREFMLSQQAPTLSVANKNLKGYSEQLLSRFLNSDIKHKLSQIAMDGSLKLPQRMLGSVRWHIANHSDFSLLALGIAAWMLYLGRLEVGQGISDITDPFLDKIRDKIQNSRDGTERVQALLGLDSVFGLDLFNNNIFVKEVERNYLMLKENGVSRTIKSYIS